MYYGNHSDAQPWVALKVDGTWYASKVQNMTSLTSSELKDSNGKVLGARFSLDSDQGLKTRDVMYPN